MKVDAELKGLLEGMPTDKTAAYSRKVTAELIRTFAEVSGDNHPLHLDSEYSKAHGFSGVIAHGALLVGFMSTASTLLSEDLERAIGRANVSLGYDRLRFVQPVLDGDTITTTISIGEIRAEEGRVICIEECRNGAGVLVAIGHHVMRFI